MRALPFFLLAFSLAGQPSQTEMERARQMVAEGRLDEAVAIYEALLKSRAGDPGLMLSLAIVEFKAQRYERVVERCRKVLEVAPDSAVASLFLGASYFQLGKAAAAVEPLRKAVAAQPKDRNSRLMLAESLLSLERYRDAAEQYHAVSEMLAENPRVWYGMERSFFWLGEQARAELERSAPDSPYAYALAGDTFLKRQEYGRAYHHLRRALATGVRIRGLQSSLGAVYRATGHSDWAKEEKAPDCNQPGLECDFAAGRYYDVALTTGKTPEALYWKARACGELGAQAMARLAALPPSSEFHELRARQLDNRGRYIESIPEWRQALKLTPGSAELQKGLGIALLNGRNVADAIPLLEGLTRQQDDAEVEFLLGSAMLQLDQPVKAIAHLESALKHRTDFAEAHGVLGEAYLKTGQFAKAIPHLQESLIRDLDGTRHFQLARAHQAAGDHQHAKEALARYKQARQEWETRRKELETDYPIGPP